MSIQGLRRVADRCRAIPGRFGLREHAVYLLTTSWSGETIGDGEETVTTLRLTAPGGYNPKVRYPSQREIALGLMSEGSVVIGPVTPQYGSGGFDRTLLDGSHLAAGEGLYVRVVGPQAPSGTTYRIKNSNVDFALHVTLVCVPAEAA